VEVFINQTLCAVNGYGLGRKIIYIYIDELGRVTMRVWSIPGFNKPVLSSCSAAPTAEDNRKKNARGHQSITLVKKNAVYHEKTETPSAWRLIIILAIQLRKTEWKRPPGAMTWWRSLVLSVYLYTMQTDFLPKSTNSVVQIVCSFINNTNSWRVLYITTNSKFSNLPTPHLGVVLFLSLDFST